MKTLTILTGSSSGLGLAMARQLLSRDSRLLCIARRTSNDLAQRAADLDAPFTQWSMDLAHGAQVAERLEAWIARHAHEGYARATLINNAGAITRVVPVPELGSEDIGRALAVSLAAPMHLCAAFLRATQGWSAARRVLNISSGLARRPMASQSTYCAAKAGLDHFSRVLALEEGARPDGARVAALSPGGIDSHMMAQLRDADPRQFPDHATFVEAKASGRLMSPEDAARRTLHFLEHPDFGQQPIADLRDHLITTGA